MSRSMLRATGAAAVARTFKRVKQWFTTNDTWVVQADAPHALYVEVGTSTHAAQPYMRPAMEAVRPRAGAIINEHGLDDGLRVIAEEIEREAKARAPVRTGELKASISVVKQK